MTVPVYTQIFHGPKGSVKATMMADCWDTEESNRELYWSIVDCLEGAYHCCFSGHVTWL